MNITKNNLTQELLLEVLEYDSSTGFLKWKNHPRLRKVYAGDIAGSVKKTGYRYITLFGGCFLAHHLVWFLHNGYWAKEIDHINHDKDDNRIENLREVNHETNMKNSPRVENNTGIQGIYYDRKRDRYISTIRINGKKVFQKSYKESELDYAIIERQAKLLELGFHQNHGN